MPHSQNDSKAEKREDERAALDAFLAAHPTFAARLQKIQSDREDSHADIRTKLHDGTWVAWQLGEWLEESQMKAAKERERLEAKIMGAIGEQGPNSTKHIRHCTLSLKEREGKVHRFDRRDAACLKTEIHGLIGGVDSRWKQNRSWQSPQGYRCTTFEAHPTLGKYLDAIHFDPRVERWVRREWPASQPWIHFEAPGGHYVSQVAVDAMKLRVKEKAEHYGTFGKEDVRLIVFYSQAALYNTPLPDLAFRSFEDLASIAAATLSHSRVQFTKVYLLKALYPSPEAFEIYPGLGRCD